MSSNGEQKTREFGKEEKEELPFVCASAFGSFL